MEITSTKVRWAVGGRHEGGMELWGGQARLGVSLSDVEVRTLLGAV